MLDDLKSQAIYIAADNPVVTRHGVIRIVIRIRKIGNTLGTRPASRPGRAYGTYEQPISDLPQSSPCIRSPPGEGENSDYPADHSGVRDWPEIEWPTNIRGLALLGGFLPFYTSKVGEEAIIKD